MPVTNSSAFVHSCGTFTEFLDLQCLLQNTLAGTPVIFIGIMALAFLMISAWLRLPIFAVGMGFILLGTILSPISLAPLVISLFIGLVSLGLQLAKAWSR